MLARLLVLAVVITPALNSAASGQPGPTTAKEFVERGRDWIEDEEYDKAIRDFDEAIRLDQKFIAAFDNRGLAYLMKGEFRKSIQDYTAVVRLDPASASAFFNRWVRRCSRRSRSSRCAGSFPVKAWSGVDAPTRAAHSPSRITRASQAQASLRNSAMLANGIV